MLKAILSPSLAILILNSASTDTSIIGYFTVLLLRPAREMFSPSFKLNSMSLLELKIEAECF